VDPLIILLVTFALMWALFILPQQRRVRQHRALLLALEPGDEIVTAGGVIGTIIGVVDDEVILRIAEGVEVRILRGAVARRIEPPAPEAPLDLTAVEELDEPGASTGAGDVADRDDDAGPDPA
jgi:preprotein translocase subunit YajC